MFLLLVTVYLLKTWVVLGETLGSNVSQIEVKIGFLTKFDNHAKVNHANQLYTRAGGEFLEVFNQAIERINQLYKGNSSDQLSLSFKPVIGATRGEENESIRLAIELIRGHNVSAVIGPHDSCQVESRLASVFNVALISHKCSELMPDSGLELQPRTLIQSKPPFWKIVHKVTALIGELIELAHCYPRQLVLLYFKELTEDLSSTSKEGQREGTLKSQDGKSGSVNSIHLSSSQKQRSNEAIQYKLIGELLELELKKLIGLHNNEATGGRVSPVKLTKLNWHTTYHYGFTRNPFRRMVRKHLLLNNDKRLNNQSHSWESAESSQDQTSAIYIVVGHYYEHLGLMLALDELGQLSDGLEGRPSISSSNQHPAAIKEQSLVIGVDIEPYDERVDSVHFLRGLLNGNRQHEHDSDLTFLAAKYSNYLGVVPAKPTRVSEFQDHILMSHNKSQAAKSPLIADESLESTSNRTSNIESLHLTGDLFRLLRLPIETFYLYDSVMLLGLYFDECLRYRRLAIEICRRGDRIFSWFANRTYVSFVNQNNVTRFDSEARADGFYSLISRRFTSLAEPSIETGDDDFGLVSVGHFPGVDSEHIELHFDFSEMGKIWLPLWCKLRQSNTSECKQINSWAQNQRNNHQLMPERRNISTLHAIVLLSISMLMALVIININWKRTNLTGCSASRSESTGWFTERDERNLQSIVYRLLRIPEISSHLDEHQKVDGHPQLELQVDLHCFMFPFPSCKFTHWIQALHQLKEMMFRYQSKVNNLDLQMVDAPEVSSIDEKSNIGLNRLKLSIRESHNSRVYDSRSFFRQKHEGSGTLKLLLHKYKSINECLCILSQLRHESVTRLLGVTLSTSTSTNLQSNVKTAKLILEGVERGDLRSSMEALGESLDEEQVEIFKGSVCGKLIGDILDGLEYLHESSLQFHGELRTTTCSVSQDWRVKLSGFHAHHMRRSLGEYELRKTESCSFYTNELIYSAPELLANHNRLATLDGLVMKSADIYSFAFILYELLVGHEPWECLTQQTSSKLLLDRVKVNSAFRPPLSRLDNCVALRRQNSPLTGTTSRDDSDIIQRIVRSCWSHSSERRPRSVGALRVSLAASSWWRSSRATSETIAKLHSSLLEESSKRRLNRYSSQVSKSEAYRYSLLPKCMALRMTNKEPITSQQFNDVSLCMFRFLLLPNLEPSSCIKQLNELLDHVDKLVAAYHGHIQLLDSQVDSSLRFLIYAGDPIQRIDPSRIRSSIYDHVALVASFALQLIDSTNRLASNSDNCLRVKCALHCGQAIGVLVPELRSSSSCLRLTRYVLIGASMQLLAELEANSLAQRIQISSEYRSRLVQAAKSPMKLNDISNSRDYIIIKREAKIQAKNLGDLEAHWLLNGPRLSASQSVMLQSNGSPN